MTLGAAQQLVERARTLSRQRGFAMSVAVVDQGGSLVLFERMDGAQLGSVDVAIGKARAALLFRRPTKLFEERIADGWTSFLSIPGSLPVDGGIPILLDGEAVGAIGVSGAKASEDGEIAQAALADLDAI